MNTSQIRCKWVRHCTAFGLAVFCLVGSRALGSEPLPNSDAVEALFPMAAAASQKKSKVVSEAQPNTEKILKKMEKRLDTIEARLGKTSRPPSLTHTVERRLTDLERRLQKIEQQLTRMQKWEQRIRRLEMK